MKCRLKSCRAPARLVMAVPRIERVRIGTLTDDRTVIAHWGFCDDHALEAMRTGAIMTDLPVSSLESSEAIPPKPAPSAASEVGLMASVAAQASHGAEAPASSMAGDRGDQPVKEAAVPDPILCSWAGCGKPRVKRLFCATCQKRAQLELGTSIVTPEQIAALPGLWAARVARNLERAKANPPPKTARPASTPAPTVEPAAVAPNAPATPAPAMFGGKWARAMESSTDQLAARRALTDRLALGEHANDAAIDAAVKDLILESQGYIRERREEIDGLRKQIEALAFGASSWHKAHQAGADGAGFTPRELKMLKRALTKLAEHCEDTEGPTGLVDVIADALGVSGG